MTDVHHRDPHDRPARSLSRRELLGYMGFTGTAMLAGGWSGLDPQPTGVAESVYGELSAKRLKTYDADGCCSLIVTDIAGLRMMTSPVPGELYFIQNPSMEGLFYYDAVDTMSADNTGTVVVSSSGARFKRIIEAGRLNARWFEAKGDGIADDTNAIRQAIAALSTTGGIVSFPNGRYRLTGTITLPDYITLVGNGNARIGFTYAEQPVATLIFDFDGVGIHHIQDTVNYRYAGGLRQLILYTEKNCTLLDLNKVQGATFQNVSFQGKSLTPYKGIGVAGSDDGSFNFFQNCHFENLEYGVNISAPAGKPFDGNFFNQCGFFSCNYGVYLGEDSDSNGFRDCNFANNQVYDINVNSQCNQFNGFRIESHTNVYNIYLDSGAKNNVLEGSVFKADITKQVLYDAARKGNRISLLDDDTHYGTPHDAYGELTCSGYTNESGFNFIQDPVSLSGIVVQGAAHTRVWEQELYEGHRICSITNQSTNAWTVAKIKTFPGAVDMLQGGKYVNASVWLKTANGKNASFPMRMALRFDMPSGVTEYYSSVVYPYDSAWHLFKVSAKTPDTVNRTPDGMYIYILIPPQFTISVAKPFIGRGSKSFNAENDLIFQYAKNAYPANGRPLLAAMHAGAMIYDTDLAAPLFWNGTEWRTAAAYLTKQATDAWNGELFVDPLDNCLKFKDNAGAAKRVYDDKTSGTASQSGNGTETTFQIPHSLNAAPACYAITPLTEDAAASFWVTADATNLTITYKTAPAAGTVNLRWNWLAQAN